MVEYHALPLPGLIYILVGSFFTCVVAFYLYILFCLVLRLLPKYCCWFNFFIFFHYMWASNISFIIKEGNNSFPFHWMHPLPSSFLWLPNKSALNRNIFFDGNTSNFIFCFLWDTVPNFAAFLTSRHTSVIKNFLVVTAASFVAVSDPIRH